MANKKTSTSRYSAYLQKISRFYQKKEVKIYTNLIFSLLAISVFIFFAIRPAVSTILSLNKEIKDQKEVVKRMDQKIENLKRAQKKYRSIENDLYLIEQALPTQAQIALL